MQYFTYLPGKRSFRRPERNPLEVSRLRVRTDAASRKNEEGYSFLNFGRANSGVTSSKYRFTLSPIDTSSGFAATLL